MLTKLRDLYSDFVQFIALLVQNRAIQCNFSLFYQRTNKLCKELKKVIPNIHLLYRRALNLKKIIPQALAKDFTDIIVINEDRRIPSILCVTVLHLNSCMTKQSI